MASKLVRPSARSFVVSDPERMSVSPFTMSGDAWRANVSSTSSDTDLIALKSLRPSASNLLVSSTLESSLRCTSGSGPECLDKSLALAGSSCSAETAAAARPESPIGPGCRSNIDCTASLTSLSPLSPSGPAWAANCEAATGESSVMRSKLTLPSRSSFSLSGPDARAFRPSNRSGPAWLAIASAASAGICVRPAK